MRKPTAVSVLLALAGGAALLLRSPDRLEATRYEDVARGLTWEDRYQDITRKALMNRGYEAGTRRFENIVKRRIADRREALNRMKANRARRDVLENLSGSKETWLRGNQGREDEVRDAEDAEKRALEGLEDDFEPLDVCGRPADVGSEEEFNLLQKYMQCNEITEDKPILVLKGKQSHGRTGNNLIEFLHAVQEARDNGIQLGIMRNSWATNLLVKMWLAIKDDNWASQVEEAFCVKIFSEEVELEGWEVIDQDTKELFFYRSEAPLGDYIASQELSIRTLFRNYNTGDGHTMRNLPAGNMCSGIDAVFGAGKADAIYSVIHSRSLEGEPGYRLLRNVARKSGCDATAALEMRPDYVRSILEPLGMMDYPIVFITDGQNSEVLDRLMEDLEIGPMIRTVPEEACWLGGDLTLGIMSNVFIGNPASTFTGFIAKTRLALGFGHNYLFRAKDDEGNWRTVCGDHCIFDKTIMGVMA